MAMISQREQHAGEHFLGQFYYGDGDSFCIAGQSKAELQFAAASPRGLEAMYVSYYAALIQDMCV